MRETVTIWRVNAKMKYLLGLAAEIGTRLHHNAQPTRTTTVDYTSQMYRKIEFLCSRGSIMYYTLLYSALMALLIMRIV